MVMGWFGDTAFPKTLLLVEAVIDTLKICQGRSIYGSHYKNDKETHLVANGLL
jgi:hypothetical protein